MKHCFYALLAALLLVSCVEEDLKTADPVKDFEAVQDGAFVQGLLNVYFSEEMAEEIEASLASGTMVTKSSDFNLALDNLQIISMRRVFPHAGEYEELFRSRGLHRWYEVEYTESTPLTKASAGLGSVSGIEKVEPVRRIVFNDYDEMKDLWGLDNTSYPEFDINVKPVWEHYTKGDPKVIVSVIDAGIDLKHEDLVGNVASTGHYNAVTGTTSITAGDHGTHVAGTIAATGGNGKGITGIAGGDASKGQKGVTLISSQIFPQESGSDNENLAARAILQSIVDGAVISQNSWGYSFDYDGNGVISGDELTAQLAAEIREPLKSAVDAFIDLAGCASDGVTQRPDSPMKGGVVIFAAGNESVKNGAPANYERIIAVGSIAKDGSRSDFSNYGKDWVDICAPGTSILSTLPGNEYGLMSGTSMACPHVSGVAALVLSYCGGPGFENHMLVNKLLNGANKTAVPASFEIGPLVDALGAIVYGEDATPAQVTDLKAEALSNTLNLEWTATADEDGKPAYGYLVLYDTDKEKLDAVTVENYTSVGHAFCIPDVDAGKKVQFAVKGLEFTKQYHVKVLAYSYGLNYAEASETLTESTGENTAPVIKNLYTGKYEFKASETLEVRFKVTDPDGHELKVTANATSAYTFTPVSGTDEYKFTVVGKNVRPGNYSVTVKATDAYGLSTSLKVNYTVLDNRPPVIVSEIEDMVFDSKDVEVVLDMDDYVFDADEEQLKYEFVLSTDKVAHLVARKNEIYVTTLAYGLVDVEIIATDVKGEEVVFSFRILVRNPQEKVSVYPNPVTDFVNVGTAEEADADITITSATGKVIYDATSKVSGLDPERIDMTGCAPGIYSVSVSYGGNQYTQNIVKL